MERVHFQQEQMLDELKDLVEKNLFTEQETKQIMKKRTGFETALVRRVAKKADYLRYATYEMGLEQLRRKRVARMKLPPGPATISDYALVRRQLHIFERAVNKFKSDVGLWVQYIEVAKREGARALVGRITARALQLHPNQPGLFILAASHELEHHSPSAARVLLQRGIRMNPESMDIWVEYLKMELGFIETLRRRWDTLGIKVVGEEEMEEYGSAEARRVVMEGGIVESVIANAGKAVCRLEMFERMEQVIRDYPSPESLRTKLLERLYSEGRHMGGSAVAFVASRYLPAGIGGRALVDGLKAANEEIVSQVMENRTDSGMHEAYVRFVEKWCKAPIDATLKEYLAAGRKAAAWEDETHGKQCAAEKGMP